MIGSQLRVLEALEAGLQIVPEISLATGIPWNQVHARLHEFKRMGLVRPVRLQKSRRSRNGERYKRYLLISKVQW
jgi:DNA-binding IclR family transcriptional regulator